MVNPKAFYDAYKNTKFLGKQARGALDDKYYRMSFNESLPPLFDRQLQMGNLRLIPVTIDPKVAPSGGWVMTEAGTRAVLGVYEDLNRAMAYFQPSAARYERMCLNLMLEITISRPATAGEVDFRKRIGENWDPELKDAILKSEYTNPFLTQTTLKRFQMGRFADGLLNKVKKSNRYIDFFLIRLLGLAQLCGIARLDLSDIEELAVNAHAYEKLARAHIAAVLGNTDVSFMSNMAFGTFEEGKPLGATEYIDTDFEKRATKLRSESVHIGTIDSTSKGRLPKTIGDGGVTQFPSGGTLLMTYPKPLDQMTKLSIHVRGDVKAQNGEPVFMQEGWATALGIRPSQSDDRPQLYDVHGNPLLYSATTHTVQVSIKRLVDNKLMAKVSAFEFFKLGKVIGQGVYGKPCGCEQQNAAFVLSTPGGPRSFNDVKLIEILDYQQSLGEIQFDDLYVQWCAGDLPAQIFNAESHLHSTYIQVRAECLYCAMDRAIGTGCTFIVAGTF